MPVSVYAEELDACERYVALKNRAAAGDTSVKVDLAVAGVRIGKLDVEELDRAVAGVDLTPEQAGVIAQPAPKRLQAARVSGRGRVPDPPGSRHIPRVPRRRR